MTSSNSKGHLEVQQWVGNSWEGRQLEMFWKKKTFFFLEGGFISTVPITI